MEKSSEIAVNACRLKPTVNGISDIPVITLVASKTVIAQRYYHTSACFGHWIICSILVPYDLGVAHLNAAKRSRFIVLKTPSWKTGKNET